MLKTFHGKKATKTKYLTRIRKHRAADNLIQGTGWEFGKGCAVGCTLEAYEHARYETELGIPEWLARLEDTIFEGLPAGKAQEWPERFLSAFAVGISDEQLKREVFHPLMAWLMLDEKNGVIRFANGHEDVESAIKLVGRLHQEQCANVAQWQSASNAADAARAAADAAWAAADAAWAAADAAWAARAAVRAAADAAWAARAAVDAARAAARAAAARNEFYEQLSDKLIELISGCKPE